MDVIILGFQTIFSDITLVGLLVSGVFLGIIFGVIPGLTATLGVTLMIPFTFAMTPEQGLTVLVGIFVGGISGGTITTILLNIPGTPASIATCYDGYPMAAKRGKPAEALSLGIFASLVGGTISAIALFTLAPMIAKIALKLMSWELFALCFLALVVVAFMNSQDIIKGLLGCIIGTLLATVGMDSIIGSSRFTFGRWELMSGFQATSLMMGLFAIRVILNQLPNLHQQRPVMKVRKVSFLPPFREINLESWRAMLLGGTAGTLIGVLPGIGQNAASIISYNQAKGMSKDPKQFGTGCVPGLVASEVANNACNGGALVPLVTLGIPGDMVTAALIGGLLIHNLQPGPRLFHDNPAIVGTIMGVYFLSNIIMYVMELGLLKFFIRTLELSLAYIFPAIIIFCIIGVYALNNLVFDVWVLIIFGIMGYILHAFNIDLVCLILGFILGPLVENYFKTALMLNEGDLASILNYPIAVTFMVLSILFFLLSLVKAAKRQARAAKSAV